MLQKYDTTTPSLGLVKKFKLPGYIEPVKVHCIYHMS